MYRVLLSYPSWAIIDSITIEVTMTEPYIPGYIDKYNVSSDFIQQDSSPATQSNLEIIRNIRLDMVTAWLGHLKKLIHRNWSKFRHC